MNLKTIIDNRYTDKDTSHSYLDVYESLFSPIRNSVMRVAEVGILHGGSIDLWSKYFSDAEIIGIDPNPQLCYDFSSNPRIRIFNQNAYDPLFVKSLVHGTFDVVLDDGPHTHQSMKDFALMYSKLLKPNGILVIEDIQSCDWIPSILKALPYNMQQNVVVYDRRHIKDCRDDILIVARNS